MRFYNQFRSIFFFRKQVVLVVTIMMIATCFRVTAEPSDCSKPSETDNWENSASSPHIVRSGCVAGTQQLFNVEGLHPPYSLWEKLGNSVPYEWSFIKEVESKFIYSTCEGPTGGCTSIKITDATGNESNTIVLGDVDGLVYSSDNPEEADPGSSVIISVEGGMPPYTWTAGGDGFSFEEEVTTGTSNILNVAEDACGAGDVTVKCPCDQAVGGSIRSTNGRWELYDHCQMFYDYGTCSWHDVSGYCHEKKWISPTEYWEISRIRLRVESDCYPASYTGPGYNLGSCPDVGSCDPPGESSEPSLRDIVFTHNTAKYRWVCQ